MPYTYDRRTAAISPPFKAFPRYFPATAKLIAQAKVPELEKLVKAAHFWADAAESKKRTDFDAMAWKAMENVSRLFEPFRPWMQNSTSELSPGNEHSSQQSDVFFREAKNLLTQLNTLNKAHMGVQAARQVGGPGKIPDALTRLAIEASTTMTIFRQLREAVESFITGH